MRGMHVAHLEAGALAGETAWSEGREATLVGDFRQRVGLVHELRQLRGAEEFAHRRRRRLGVDQVVRHHRVDLYRAHALADRPLHAQEPDAVLVLHQLADRANAPIAEMIDVVDFAAPVLELDKNLENRQYVLLTQRADGVGRLLVEPGVHLDAANGRQIIALAVEKQAAEQGFRRFQSRRRGRCR